MINRNLAMRTWYPTREVLRLGKLSELMWHRHVSAIYLISSALQIVPGTGNRGSKFPLCRLINLSQFLNLWELQNATFSLLFDRSMNKQSLKRQPRFHWTLRISHWTNCRNLFLSCSFDKFEIWVNILSICSSMLQFSGICRTLWRSSRTRLKD